MLDNLDNHSESLQYNFICHSLLLQLSKPSSQTTSNSIQNSPLNRDLTHFIRLHTPSNQSHTPSFLQFQTPQTISDSNLRF